MKNNTIKAIGDNDQLDLPPRIPRPLGLTTIAKHHQAQNTNKSKSTLINHILTNYINQGFMFNGKACSIDELSFLTSIPTHTIIKGMNNASVGLGKLTNQEGLEDTIRALQSVGISQSLKASGLMAEQIEILRASQGGKYKAFISSTYNIALKNGLDASKQIMEMARALMPQQGTTFNIQNNNINADHKVSAADAIRMVEEQNGRINPGSDTVTHDALYLTHDIGNMPEVNARKQTGKGANEGLNMNKVLEIQDAKVIKEDDHHDTRREKEYEIDPDSDQI